MLTVIMRNKRFNQIVKLFIFLYDERRKKKNSIADCSSGEIEL